MFYHVLLKSHRTNMDQPLPGYADLRSGLRCDLPRVPGGFFHCLAKVLESLSSKVFQTMQPRTCAKSLTSSNIYGKWLVYG